MLVSINVRVCLRGGGGPRVGEVTRLDGVTRLSIFWSRLHDRWGDPPRRVSRFQVDVQVDQLRVFSLYILPTARLIAIEVESSGRPCIIGSFSDGKVTNSSWKCTSGTELDWKKPGFNDSLWKSAVKLNSGRERDLDRGCLINEIQRHGAKWITSADNGQQNMYCRLNRFVWCFL